MDHAQIDIPPPSDLPGDKRKEDSINISVIFSDMGAEEQFLW